MGCTTTSSNENITQPDVLTILHNKRGTIRRKVLNCIVATVTGGTPNYNYSGGHLIHLNGGMTPISGVIMMCYIHKDYFNILQNFVVSYSLYPHVDKWITAIMTLFLGV